MCMYLSEQLKKLERPHYSGSMIFRQTEWYAIAFRISLSKINTSLAKRIAAVNVFFKKKRLENNCFSMSMSESFWQNKHRVYKTSDYLRKVLNYSWHLTTQNNTIAQQQLETYKILTKYPPIFGICWFSRLHFRDNGLSSACLTANDNRPQQMRSPPPDLCLASLFKSLSRQYTWNSNIFLYLTQMKNYQHAI